MANTLQYIQNLITGSIPQLSNLSNTSILYKLISIFSSVIDVQKQEITNSQNLISNNVALLRNGTQGYYIYWSLYFQYGDQLLLDSNFQPYYPTITPANNVIKKAALIVRNNPIIDDEGVTYFKQNVSLNVANKDSNGFLIPLTAPQLVAFTNYMNGSSSIQNPTDPQGFAWLGIPLTIFSVQANIISFATMTYYYNKNYDKETVKTGVINAMIALETSTELGATFRSNDLEQAVRTVDGVIDFVVTGGMMMDVTAGTETAFSAFIELPAGYFTYVTNFQDDLIGLPI